MAADTDPPPLPRPDATPADPLTARVAEAWARAGERTGALLTPALVFVAVAVVGILAWSRLASTAPPPLEVALPTVDPAAMILPTESVASAEPATAVVHVAGAVAHPGVYEVSATARVGDAVDLAGGPTVEADLDRINLAATVTDGGQINVPRIGQTLVAPLEPTMSGGSPGVGVPIDINTADAALLETLPGVGPSTAAAIIGHREEHGPFPSVAALDDVSGIGPARLDALRDLVTAGGAP